MGTVHNHIAMATVQHSHAEAEAAFWRVVDFARTLSVGSVYTNDDYTRLLVRVPGMINGAVTYLCVPDGSKEGWAISDNGDLLRAEFDRQFSRWERAEANWGELGHGIVHRESDL